MNENRFPVVKATSNTGEVGESRQGIEEFPMDDLGN
jgi:hypothetical protein